jgi:hypothetical protein
MYVCDHHSERIQVRRPNAASGITIQRFVPNSHQRINAAVTNTTGNALDELNGPSGVTVDDQLNLYIVDTKNERVMK